jgi:transposase
VQQALRENPFAGDLFVFQAKRADRVKMMAWDGTGLCLSTSAWRKVASSARQYRTERFA